MTAELDKNILGGYDGIEFDGIDGLVELIALIKELDDEAYKFVMTNTKRRMDN